jgi:translation initiation factor IF-1
MSILRFLIASLAFVLWEPTTCFADTKSQVRFSMEGQKPPPAELADLSFFEGLWRGEVFGLTVEHQVMSATRGQMPGLVRIMSEDRVVMFELSSFIETGGSLTYRNRHFEHDLVAKQQPHDYVDRTLVAKAEGVLYFNGITFARVDESHCVVTFTLMDEDGQQRTHIVNYTRVADEG